MTTPDQDKDPELNSDKLHQHPEQNTVPPSAQALKQAKTRKHEQVQGVDQVQVRPPCGGQPQRVLSGDLETREPGQSDHIKQPGHYLQERKSPKGWHHHRRAKQSKAKEMKEAHKTPRATPRRCPKNSSGSSQGNQEGDLAEVRTRPSKNGEGGKMLTTLNTKIQGGEG